MASIRTMETAARALEAQPSERPRKVLVLVDLYHGPFGGTEGQIHTLLQHLPAGWTAELWMLRKSPVFEETTLRVPTRVLGIGSLGTVRTWLCIRKLAAAVRREGFGLIHTFMNDSSVVGALAARRAGVPLIVSRRDLGFWQTPRWLQILRRTNRYASAVLANAAAVARHTARTEHVPPGMIHVVHNGQDPARFDVPADPGLRARLGVPADAPVVGMLANVKALKRQDDLLDAFERLAGQHPGLHVWFIGEDPGDDPPDQPRLVERVQARGLTDRVHVFRAEGNAIPVLKHLDIGVLCSRTEGLSNSILEYLACGLPVVATRVGGNPDLVEHDVHGLLYEPGDVGALTRHLDALLSDAPRARALGDAARKRFEAEFTVERMVRETTRHYAAVLADAPPPGRETLRIEVLEDASALEAIAPAWQALLGPNQFFAGPDWVLCALRHGSPRGTPCVLVARDADGRLVGVLPLARLPGGVLELAGRRLGGDHLDVVAADGLADAFATAALEHLLTLSWRRVRLGHVTEGGALRLAVRRGRWRWPLREHLSTRCPYLPIRGSFDDFLAGHTSSTFRRNVRRYTKRFLETEGAEVEQVREPEAVRTAVDRFFVLHAERFRERGESSSVSDDLRAFHHEVAERAARAGRVAFTFLRVAGRDVACEYAFVDGHTRYAFQGGQDGSAAVTSPGLVLRAFVLRDEVFAAGLAEYDFLDGSEAYKARWTSRARRLFDLELQRPGLRGRLRSLIAGTPRFLRDLWRPRGASGDDVFEEDVR